MSYLSQVGTLFNLGVPDWLADFVQIRSVLYEIKPQCLLVLPYWQKWMLWMLSPILLGIAMGIYYYLRILLAKSAVHLRDKLDLACDFCEVCESVSRQCCLLFNTSILSNPKIALCLL